MMEGKGMVPPSLRQPLLDAAQSHKDLRWASRSNDYFADIRDSYGHTPSPDTVLRAVAAAAECSAHAHPEANWNLEVHQRVLELAFRPPDQPPFRQLVNFMGR